MGKVGRTRPRKTVAVEGGLILPMKKMILKLCVLAGLLSGAAVDAADKAGRQRVVEEADYLFQRGKARQFDRKHGNQ